MLLIQGRVLRLVLSFDFHDSQSYPAAFLQAIKRSNTSELLLLDIRARNLSRSSETDAYRTIPIVICPHFSSIGTAR